MHRQLVIATLGALALAACDQANTNQPAAAAKAPAVAPSVNAPNDPQVEPPAPGAPGGLPDDRTPISEAPFTRESAQGAADVVQTYFTLIGEKKYAAAWKLWSDGGKASGLDEPAFAASFGKFAEYQAQVGAPGKIEGAAGSLYVDVPVVIYGRLKTGEEVHQSGRATLRRVNNVPGSTAEQRAWHIASMALKP